MRIVVALGGDALRRRSERSAAAVELEHIPMAAIALAPLCRDHDVLCHGNGPNLGWLAIKSTDDTDVSAVMDGLGIPHTTPVSNLEFGTFGRLHFATGSIGPKIEVCVRYAPATGNTAAIGALSEPRAILAASAGTTITSTRVLNRTRG